MNMHGVGMTGEVALARLDDLDQMKRIDAFVLAHPEGQLFQRPAWLQAVAKGTGQRGFFFVANGASGRIAGVLPVTEMRSRLFGRALASSGFGVGGGALGDPDAARSLAKALWDHARLNGFPTAELRGGAEPGSGWSADEGAHANFARDLENNDEAQLLAIPRKQRAEVRKAIGHDFDVAIGRGPGDRAAHHSVYAQSVRNLGTPVFPRRLFDAMLDAFGEDAEILTIRKDGVALASVLSFRHRDTIMPYWGGGTADARTWRANDAMYWELMKRARAIGCTRFDFGRSKLGSGAYAFKKNWGFTPEPLRYWTRGERRAVSPNDARYRRKIELWKKLPLPVATFIGPMLSRGLG